MCRSHGAGARAFALYRDGSGAIVLCRDSAGAIYGDAAGADGTSTSSGRLFLECVEYVGLLELCGGRQQRDCAGQAVLSGAGGAVGQSSAVPLYADRQR